MGRSQPRTGINLDAKRVNGAVCVFDHGGRIDDVGQHHGRRRPSHRALRQPHKWFRARIVNIHQLELALNS